jgi:uncharacterized protein (DUF1800 family)
MAPLYVRLAVFCLLTTLAATDPAEAGRRRASPMALQEHVLNRTGYGPDAWSRARIAELGVNAYLQEQLHPETLDDSAFEPLLAGFPSLEMGLEDIWRNYGPAARPGGAAEVLAELRNARLLRALASRRQLEEVLVDFWFNHFNVYAMGSIYYDASPLERLAIRPHVLGRFEDMLLAVARSPAMSDYLDNMRNEAGSLVENYARELLELHTLGVGNFTETDMVEVARCFTGWKIDRFFGDPDGFKFVLASHDQGPKSLLGGLEIPANGGYQDGVDVIQFLATHPSTAEHISRKLVIRFVSEDPPSGLVSEASATFLATDGDLRAVTETILESREFRQSRQAKVKRPIRLLVSAARAVGADPAQLDLSLMSYRAYSMGEDLYRARPPTGYPDISEAWAGPGQMILRFNAMENVARGREGHVFTHPSAATTVELVNALIASYFVAGVSSETRDGAIAWIDGLGLAPSSAAAAQQAAAYLLSSPEFQRH